MDEALITFMMQTSPSTQSVHLIGSWDNFAKHYPMERDTRRAHGQWRGCYAFEDIICDGEGGSSPKRTGGLKMGSTYYYYYELDNGTEHYDATVPFTTSCPYLPGQPVNLLHVPIEVQPLRYRSASMSSMANQDIKTMNPADKFMTPRPSPPLPGPQRLNTATSVLTKKRSARSLSPKSDKQWSPRNFFGLRSPPATSQQSDKRGRSHSLGKMAQSHAGRSTPNLNARAQESRKVKSVPHTRAPSPQSLKTKPRTRSPYREVSVQDINFDATTFSPTFNIQQEVIEEVEGEVEDDDNFASYFNRMSMTDKGIFTALAPPPSRRRSPARSPVVKDTAKPLPNLPEEDALMPPPLRLRTAVSNLDLPRSHFSTSTIASEIDSPSESHFSFSDAESVGEENLTADYESGDESTDSPLMASMPTSGFSGYSLPEEDYVSAQTLTKQTPLSPFREPASRITFGAPPTTTTGSEPENMSALEQLMSEMGYLGDVIVGK